jgi:hypothetical protein
MCGFVDFRVVDEPIDFSVRSGKVAVNGDSVQNYYGAHSVFLKIFLERCGVFVSSLS